MMTRGDNQRSFCVLSLFVVVLFFLTAVPCFSSTGVLLSVKGKVSVKAHGLASPAKTGMRLMPGVTVKSEGGTASLVLDDGRVRRVNEGGDFTVPEEEKEGAGDRLVARLMETIRETTHRGRGPSIKGMVRGEGEIALVYPYNSFVTLNDLRFEWEDVEGMVDVVVQVKSPSPVYRHAFKTEPEKTEARLPEDAPPLTPGIRYYWKVTGFEEINREAFRSKLGWFAILRPDQEKTLEAEMRELEAMSDLEEAGRTFLKANLFISYGLYHRALPIIEKSLEQYPGNEGMKEVLVGVHVKMKKVTEAEEPRK